jgi:hypothetical protein
MGYNLEPNIEKPQQSIEKIVNKISPFLETISKAAKVSGSENMSDNKSSVSKAEKNITPYFRTTNTELLKLLAGNKSLGLKNKYDLTITLR